MTQRLAGEAFTVTHSVGQTQRRIRLDQFVMEIYRHRSREKLKRAIDVGAISIIRNSSPHLILGKVKPSTVLQPGDFVKVHSVKRKEPEVNFDYKILYEDETLLVVMKPANLPVHPAGRFFFNTLLSHLKTDGFNPNLLEQKEFYLVHRIDKETSGILLVAKTKEACFQLTTQFKNRETGKYYLALVHGAPKETSFTVNYGIGKVMGSKVGLKMFPVPENEGGSPSLTEFELVESRGDFSLLACFPKTGRQHQIRVHAEMAGVPLVGDKIYGLSDDEACALMAGNREYELSLKDEAEVSEEVIDDELQSAGATNPSLLLADDAEEINDETDEEEHPTQHAFDLQARSKLVLETYEIIKKKLLLPRHALHAAGLRFVHPVSGKEMVFESGLPPDLQEFYESIDHKPLREFKTKRWGY